MTIRTKFFLIFFIIAIGPLLILSSYILYVSQASISNQVREGQQTVATNKSNRLKLIMDGQVEKATLLSTRPTLVDLTSRLNQSIDQTTAQKAQQYLNDARRSLPEALDISLQNVQHTVVASTNTKRIGTTSSGQSSKKVELLLTNSALPSLSIKLPVYSKEAIVGYLELHNQGRQLDTITQDYTGLGKTGDVLLARNIDGSIILSRGRHSGKDADQQKLYSQITVNQITQAIAEHKDTSGITKNGVPFFFTVKYLPNANVSLIFKIDAGEAFRPTNVLRDTILLFSFICVFLIIIVILFFVHNITGPLANLIAVAEQVRGGNLNQRALVLSNDDIGSLARSFNLMLDELSANRNNLELKVEERTEQLQATNKELESFSYSVSHDLRAPLRAIDGFSKILSEDYGDKLDEDGKRVIATISNSTRQMGQLIDDLLAFSRLGRREVRKQEVSMEQVARESYEELKLLEPQRNVQLHLPPLPTAFVDASLIQQVWINLFSNALKFTRGKEPAIIEVGATVEQNSITYFVKDNGAGFDMAYVDKLFGVFQRLHDQREFEGTGVGLALVKRIITRNGGKVWAEGQVGKGATIYFSLPKERHN